MRHPRFFSEPALLLILIAIVLTLISDQAIATPVYLKLESQFPSGHYKRRLLENRTKKIQTQLWYRLQTSDKVYGWIPESELVTGLKLISEAILKEASPLRSEASLDSVEQELLTKGTRVQILNWEGSWARVRFQSEGASRETWLSSESLMPAPNQKTEKIFVKPRTLIFALPGPNARPLQTVAAPTIMNVLSEKPDGWFEVRIREASGFIRRADTITYSDLGETKAYALSDRTPLKTAPLPYADVTRHIASTTTLHILNSQTLRWGQAKLQEVGEIWWPMHEASDEDRDTHFKEEISTSELFKRKLFDMASSPAISSLRFASAQGIYRTVNGSQWTKIPFFNDKNYPIAVSGAGVVFVGPYISEDHGETFKQWIRWDTLVKALKRYPNLSAQKLQFHEIHPEDPNGRRVTLKLGISKEFLVTLATTDQGRTWH